MSDPIDSTDPAETAELAETETETETEEQPVDASAQLTARRRWLPSSKRWLWLGAAGGVLILAAGTAVVAHEEFDGGRHEGTEMGSDHQGDDSQNEGEGERGHGRADGERGEGRDNSREEGRENDDDYDGTNGRRGSAEDRDQSPIAPAASSNQSSSSISTIGSATGPVVIEPATPGGERTVVWPDGRIVTIPATGATTTTTPTAVAPPG